MNNLISKLQYKTYEKGEFSDEQSRSLEETLTLIKAFPWDEQRGADIIASGPGIVIKGLADDYLKVSIYFNGKYTVYYLSSANYLYEFHTADLDLADQKVTDFFCNKLSLTDFEKHLFNIGYADHFINKSFWYSVNKGREKRNMLLFGAIIAFYAVLATYRPLNKPYWLSHILYPLGMVFLTLTFLQILFLYISIYKWSKNMKLWLAKGNNVVAFDDGTGVQSFLKSEISTVTMYGRNYSRGRSIDFIMEIIFNDGRTIKFPGMLLSPLQFIDKMKNNVQLNYVNNNKLLWRTLRQIWSNNSSALK